MPRTATRRRQRCARIERQHAEIVAEIETIHARLADKKDETAMADLVALIRRIAASELCVWDFERQLLGVSDQTKEIPDTETNREMRALIAQIVAGWLTWSPPRIVRLRDRYARPERNRP